MVRIMARRGERFCSTATPRGCPADGEMNTANRDDNHEKTSQHNRPQSRCCPLPSLYAPHASFEITGLF